jgi:tripartite-type tricarboxylate transporter receptor subunit TctC
MTAGLPVARAALDGYTVLIGNTGTHVPCRGAGPAVQDLVGGRIDYMCDTI